MSREQSSAPKAGITETLRGDILRGRLAPGQRLKAANLARELDASHTVVREALNRLAGERLVDFEPQIGFSVRSLSAEDLCDLVEQRILFESIALRRCMSVGDIKWQAEVLAAHHLLSHTPMLEKDGSLSAAWVERHDAFHSASLSACGSPRLFDFLRRLAHEAEIYHRALLPVVSRDQEMEGEHASLTQAILDGDVEAAISLLVQHQTTTRDRMLPLLHVRAQADTLMAMDE